jgi:cytochrome d ubiquinol oxidase subunit II
MHGCLWVHLKTTGAVNERTRRVVKVAWWSVTVFTIVVTAVTFAVLPQLRTNFSRWPWGFVFPILSIAGLVGVQFELRRRNEHGAFLASCAYLLGMLGSVVFTVYPMVLPARDGVHSLTISNAKAGAYGLKVGLVWWIVGMILVTGYFQYVYRSSSGKVTPDADHAQK